MKDQIDALAAKGIAARRLDSTLSLEEYREAIGEVRAGRLRLLYVAPERFLNERFCETIRRTPISLFAVDEAHCISEWGHNFRPDYLRLAQFSEQCGAERILALTATATEKVLGDICRFFRIDAGCAVRTGFYRPNLTLLLTPTTPANRDGYFLKRLRERPTGPTIVYVTLQKTAEQLASRLEAEGFPAKYYHAGMEDEERAAVQDWFIDGKNGIVVATIAFGMGIDKADIRYVYHYNLSKSLENYAQEIGRAGRDGQPAICETFFCPEDLGTLENFAYGDTPTFRSVEAVTHEVFSQADSFDANLYDMSFRHDIRLTVLRTLLTYLELKGYLESGTPFYATYKFKPATSSAQIIGHFEGERKTFLTRLFQQAQKRKIWYEIDLEGAGKALGEPRDRIVRALDYLAEQRHLELEASGVRHRFHIKKKPDDLANLAQSLHDRTLQREEREIFRLRQVAELVELNGCQVASLGGHFAETLDKPCGHCSWCLGGQKPAVVPARPTPPIDETIWTRVATLQRNHPDEFPEPRSLARFLCGANSPRTVRAKLQVNRLYGALEDVPFPEILKRLESGK